MHVKGEEEPTKFHSLEKPNSITWQSTDCDLWWRAGVPFSPYTEDRSMSTNSGICLKQQIKKKAQKPSSPTHNTSSSKPVKVSFLWVTPKYEVLTAVLPSIRIFWIVMSCLWLSHSWDFKVSYLHTFINKEWTDSHQTQLYTITHSTSCFDSMGSSRAG